jgi:hypothetical protein
LQPAAYPYSTPASNCTENILAKKENRENFRNRGKDAALTIGFENSERKARDSQLAQAL